MAIQLYPSSADRTSRHRSGYRAGRVLASGGASISNKWANFRLAAKGGVVGDGQARRCSSRRRNNITAGVFCTGLGLLAACASVPDFDEDPGSMSASAAIIGGRGPLTPRQSQALLARLSRDPGDAGLLERHLAIEQAVAESPLVTGNRTRILRDGPEAFRAIFAAIRAAKQHINLEFFILEDVECDGSHLGDLLVAKLAAGVAVNVIYDSYGSSDTPAAFFDRLKRAGARVTEFNPINPLDVKARYSINDRDHRKILVTDGAAAIIGGINLSTTYQSNPLGKSGVPAGQSAKRTRDTDLQIEGPVVAQVQKLFFEHWGQQKGPEYIAANYFPVVPPRGTETVRIVGSSPDYAVPRFYVTLLSAMRSAEKSISISAAYFVPTHQEMEALTEAARRGVVVRLLLPDQSDSGRAIDAGHSRYSDLLEAGVKIYETHDLVLHSKTAVIDGVWTAIGSSNFDQRSVLFNDEVDAIVLGSGTAQAMEAIFTGNLVDARPIDLAAWEKRPFPQRLREFLSRTWQTLL